MLLKTHHRAVLCFFLLCLTAIVTAVGTAARCRAEDPALPVIQAGGKTVSGIVLNNEGVIAVPLLDDGTDAVVAQFEGEQYPARTLARWESYGVTLLKIDRQKPFRPAALAQRLAPSSAHLRLVGRTGIAGAGTYADTVVSRVRRKIPEKSLDGSYYEIVVPAGGLLDGAALVDADSGEVYGMLIRGVGETPATRWAILSSSLSNKVAAENLVIGAGEAPKGLSILFTDGRSASAPLRQLQFLAATGGRENAVRARNISTWRSTTGFLTNALTSPEITGTNAYFGDLSGGLYCIDLATMQREWVFPNYEPVFYPPTVGENRICIASGYIQFKSYEEEDAGLMSVIGSLAGIGAATRTTHEILDIGYINCVDKQSGVFKWVYRTRYMTQPVIVGNRVLYSGFDILGALNLLDGKRIWEMNERHGQGKAYYYTIAGADDQKMWVMCLPTKLAGEGRKRDPYRLEKDSNAWVECYWQNKDSEPIWSHRYNSPGDGPPLSAAVTMSHDKKVMYGATSRGVFAYDAQSGDRLWDTDTFPLRNFAGSLTTGPSLVFATTLDNKLYAVSAVDGTVAWTFEGARAPLCVPLFHEGIVYVGSLDTWVYALDAKNGRLVWKFETQGKVCGQPRIVGNKLYTMTDDGRLSEIDLPQ